MLKELEKITLDNAPFLSKDKGTSMAMKDFTLTIKSLGKVSIYLVGIGSLVAWKND